MYRILTNTLIIVCLFIFPWWVVVLLSLTALFVFRRFYEVVAAGLAMDLLYSGSVRIDGVTATYPFALAALLLLLLIPPLKTWIRFY